MAEQMRDAEARHTRDLQTLQFQLMESSDKASFEAKALADSLYKKMAPKVEQELANLRRQGQNISRENIFYFLVGKSAVESRNSGATREQRRAAEARVRKATTKPANVRSDTGATRQRQQVSLEKRLENVSI